MLWKRDRGGRKQSISTNTSLNFGREEARNIRGVCLPGANGNGKEARHRLPSWEKIPSGECLVQNMRSSEENPQTTIHALTGE
jgi:hypothetical protein